MATCVYFLVTFFLFADAYRPPIKVFEITKTRDQDSQVDTQYYDPELTRINKKTNKKNINNLAHYIVTSLQSENDEDYKDSPDENVFIDKTRSLPIIILPKNHAVYREKPGNYRILHKLLHSALRSNDDEDRTAAPRHRGHYDDNYY